MSSDMISVPNPKTTIFTIAFFTSAFTANTKVKVQLYTMTYETSERQL